jgi:hypothetical protein
LTENEEDFLAWDNVAWAVHEGGVSNRTLLVTPGNIFLERVYAVLPGIEAFKTGPEEPVSTEGGGEFDLYVFDSVPLPDPLPAADMLIVNPVGENPLLRVTGVFTGTPVLNVTRLSDSPLLQFVDWSDVHIRQAKSVEAGWAQRLIETEQGPLLLTGEQNGYRVAILTFDLHDSDLPLQIAFPILMANITGWLSPGRAFDAPTGLQPGDPIGITPGASTTEVVVTKPDGSPWSADVGEEAIFFTETDQPGLYAVALRDEAGARPAGSFAVNLFAPIESALQPAEAVTFGQTTVESAAEGDVGQRELWPWLAAVAFIVLIVEWWVHHRGTRLPQLPGRAS